MIYKIIDPPIPVSFDEMSKEQLEAYAHWFRDALQRRSLELETAVRDTPGFETWTTSFEPESLERLGSWFHSVVTLRHRAPDEMKPLKTRGGLIDAPSHELTDQSFSLAIDVGLYLARVVERSHPSLKWRQFLGDKRSIDYGMPVLTGQGKVPLNPVRTAIALAYGLASGKQSGTRLKEIFEYWSQQISKAS